MSTQSCITPWELGTPTGVVALGVGGVGQGGSWGVAAGVLLPGVAKGIGVFPGVRYRIQHQSTLS